MVILESNHAIDGTQSDGTSPADELATIDPPLAAVLTTADEKRTSPAAVYLARLAPGSRRTMRGALDTIARLATAGAADAMSCPWHLLRYEHTQALRARLAAAFAVATANKILSALRGVLREAWRLDLMDAETYHRAADLEPARGETLLAGREVTPGERKALFRVCSDGTPAGARDAALFAVLYGSGLRRSEAVALDVSDVNTTNGAVAVRRGKGAKEREVFLPTGARAAVADWLARRGEAPGPLFVPINKGGRLTLRRMSDAAVLCRLKRRAVQASIATCSPHDLRRTFVGGLLDAGADLAVAQRLCGYSAASTTAATIGDRLRRSGAPWNSYLCPTSASPPAEPDRCPPATKVTPH